MALMLDFHNALHSVSVTSSIDLGEVLLLLGHGRRFDSAKNREPKCTWI